MAETMNAVATRTPSAEERATRQRTRRSWAAMRSRCLNPRASRYALYGGRGITVCDRWRYSFEAFFSDMGGRPEGTTLDRIDVNGHYEPGNCRWATPRQQCWNTRRTVRVTVGGVTRTTAEWALVVGLPARTLRDRAWEGWSAQDILSTPYKARAPLSAEPRSLCARGHRLEGENVRMNHGRRYCAACRRVAERARRARARGAVRGGGNHAPAGDDARGEP